MSSSTVSSPVFYRRISFTLKQDHTILAQQKWTCELCDVTFSFQKNLKAHEKTSRSHLAKLGHSTATVNSLHCSLCVKTFSKKSGLKRHFLVQHGIDHEDELKDVVGSRRIQKTFRSDGNCNAAQTINQTTQGTPEPDSTIAPKLSVHDILIFMPAYGDGIRRTKTLTQDSTFTDRNCFAMIILAVALSKAVGQQGNVKMLISSAMPLADFVDAASHLQLTREFTAISSNLITFTNEEDMVDAFKNFAKFSTSSCLRSLFVYGHGDATRIKITFDGSSSYLSSAQLANMISTSCCDITHIMTCKASKLITSMAATKKAKGSLLNGKVLFLGYGDDDITTVPLQFAEGAQTTKLLIYFFIHVQTTLL